MFFCSPGSIFATRDLGHPVINLAKFGVAVLTETPDETIDFGLAIDKELGKWADKRHMVFSVSIISVEHIQAALVRDDVDSSTIFDGKRPTFVIGYGEEGAELLMELRTNKPRAPWLNYDKVTFFGRMDAVQAFCERKGRDRLPVNRDVDEIYISELSRLIKEQIIQA